MREFIGNQFHMGIRNTEEENGSENLRHYALSETSLITSFTCGVLQCV